MPFDKRLGAAVVYAVNIQPSPAVIKHATGRQNFLDPPAAVGGGINSESSLIAGGRPPSHVGEMNAPI